MTAKLSTQEKHQILKKMARKNLARYYDKHEKAKSHNKENWKIKIIKQQDILEFIHNIDVSNTTLIDDLYNDQTNQTKPAIIK